MDTHERFIRNQDSIDSRRHRIGRFACRMRLLRKLCSCLNNGKQRDRGNCHPELRGRTWKPTERIQHAQRRSRFGCIRRCKCSRFNRQRERAGRTWCK